MELKPIGEQLDDAGERLVDLLSELENSGAHHAATGPPHDTWCLLSAAAAAVSVARVLVDYCPVEGLVGF